MPPMDEPAFCLLGSVGLHARGHAVPLGGARQRALLALLLLNANRVLSRDAIVDALWGSEPPAGAGHALETAISRLRKTLRQGGVRAQVVTRGTGYSLELSEDDLDLTRFEELAAQARQADAEHRAALLREALALWKGTALADVDAPFQPHERMRLEELHLAALEDALAAELELGQTSSAVAELQQLAAQHPYRERPRALLMLALYRSGRQPDALELYRRTRRELDDELGLEPSTELRELEQAILRHDPKLSATDIRRDDRASRITAAGEETSEVAPRLADRLGRISGRTVGLLVLVAAVGAAAVLLVSLRLADGGATAVAANAAVSITGGQRAGREVEVGTDPTAAVVGGGWVWTANSGDGTVSRIDPRTGATETIPVGEDPTALAFGAGFLWVADAGGRTVAQVSPRAAKVEHSFVTGNGPAGVAFGDGAVWVSSATDGTLVRVDPAGREALHRIPVGSEPGPVAFGDGAVWVGVRGAGTVARIDPRSRAVVQTVQVGNDPSALLVTAGSVWVANADDGTASRIDASTGTVGATIPVGGTPSGLAARGSEIWVALAGGRSLVEIDAARAQVVHRVLLGKPAAGIAAFGNAVWATTLSLPEAHRGGTLAVETAGQCGCVDPAIAYDPPDWRLLDLVYDGLLGYRRVGGPAGAQLVGDLAVSVPQPSDGGRTYVFRLRRGVRFSNGQPLRPTDVVASFQRLFSVPQQSAPHRFFYGTIVGASGCRAGAGCDLSRGIVADNAAGTVTFHLKGRDPDFLYRLALPFAFVLPAETRVAARVPIPGTGPYRISRFLPNRTLELVRNRRFKLFAPAATPDGYPDRILAHMTGSDEQRATAVVAGHGDIAPDLELPPRTVRTLALVRPEQLHADPGNHVEFFFLNAQVPPFSNTRVRRAVNFAADREGLARLQYDRSAATPTCQILPPSFRATSLTAHTRCLRPPPESRPPPICDWRKDLFPLQGPEDRGWSSGRPSRESRSPSTPGTYFEPSGTEARCGWLATGLSTTAGYSIPAPTFR